MRTLENTNSTLSKVGLGSGSGTPNTLYEDNSSWHSILL